MRIDQLLELKEMTKTELANRIGWTPQRLNSRLKSNNPKIDTVQKIAKALNCEIHELFETSEDYAHWYDKGEWLGIRRK